MSSSVVKSFSEPDEYAAAIRQGTHQFTVTQRGIFRAKLSRIDLHHLWMQRFSEDLARTSHVDGWGGRAVIAFGTKPVPSLVRDATELNESSISWLRPGHSYYQSSSGPVTYGTMSLSLEDLTILGSAIVGRELKIPDSAVVVTPSPVAMARLQRLHAAAAILAEDAPAMLAHPDASRGLEQSLIEAMIICLGGTEFHQDRMAPQQHAAIMRRFHQVVGQYGDQPLYLPDLCVKVGASERTLRACCQEHLGTSPKRFLVLRRMQLFRRALRESTPATATVTEIATRFGFWQFGRLAGEYRAFFGEAPSETLARQ
jgi:AraC-like DNA-binding protein